MSLRYSIIILLVLSVLLAAGLIFAMERYWGPLTIESPAFPAGSEMPIRYTGEGRDVSPPLSWSGIPSKTKSLALIVDDPDYPDPDEPEADWAHWVLYNIPPSVKGLPEGAKSLPAGTGEGLNDWSHTGYSGPLPPTGRHRYFYRLYALDVVLTFPTPPTKSVLEKAMHDHILEQASVMGTFLSRRPKPP